MAHPQRRKENYPLMANNDVNNPLGFVDKRKATLAGDGGAGVTTPGNYASITALRTRLTAVNAGYYTSAMLDALTENDMIYALRVADDNEGI